jgi:hypothetical protein
VQCSRSYLAAMAEFRNYSFGNIMLIARQKPDATNHQRRLRSPKIFYPLFKFLPINRSPFVETGILDCRRHGDCK